jgi:UDP-N-acetylglucosamine--N-acetylmuramyl-(pentapeptide) pyrophosphoryl-undecaprenol N-acetylglucosamine transferase
MNIVLTAGGGGHFAPLLAFLSQLNPEDSVHIIGRKYAFEGDRAIALEYQTAKQKGLSYTPITTGRLQRTFTRYTLPSLAKIPIGLYQSLRLLRTIKPDVVVSFGGYVTVPVVIAAKMLGIPIVVHEQTPFAGLANKIAARFATKICVSWESSFALFPKEKTVLTGNPMQEISHHTNLPKNLEIPGNQPLLVVVGGSLGSHTVNSILEQSLSVLVESYRIIHQTGDAKAYQDYERLINLKNSLPDPLKSRYVPVKFLDPEIFPTVLAEADLVISRAGINTALYLLQLEKPTLLIPLPHGQKNEQAENAKLLQSYGIAEILEESKFEQNRFVQLIHDMVKRKAEYKRKNTAAQPLAPTDAAKKIYEVVQEIAQ